MTVDPVRLFQLGSLGATGLLLVGVVCSSSALAQGVATDAYDPEDWSLYVRAGASAAFVSDLNQELSFDPGLAFIESPPTGRSTEFGTSFIPSLAVGVSYPAGTRTELEYKYIAPNVDLTRETGGFNSVTGGSEGVAVTPPDDFRAHFLMANAYVDVFRSGSTALFLGAGVGGGFFNNGFDQTDAAFAYQGRTGISVDVSDSITLMAEYVYLRTLEMKFGPSAFSAENTVTDPRVVGEPFVMSNVGVSVLFKF